MIRPTKRQYLSLHKKLKQEYVNIVLAFEVEPTKYLIINYCLDYLRTLGYTGKLNNETKQVELTLDETQLNALKTQLNNKKVTLIIIGIKPQKTDNYLF